jgi:hypothetical protein
MLRKKKEEFHMKQQAQVQAQETVTFEANQGGRFRWVAVTALLLAIGAILHLVTPNIAGLTLNWMIAMYCLAINLVRPTLGQVIGIGLVAGALNVPTSKSAIPYANLISEPIGALTCALFLPLVSRLNIGGLPLAPGLTGFFSTVASGFTFVTLLKVILSIPNEVYLYGMLPVVLAVGAANGVITQLLYLPARKLLNRQED